MWDPSFGLKGRIDNGVNSQTYRYLYINFLGPLFNPLDIGSPDGTIYSAVHHMVLTSNKVTIL
jgi:hypothetical protein